MWRDPTAQHGTVAAPQRLHGAKRHAPSASVPAA
jgi:hypothetical protein